MRFFELSYWFRVYTEPLADKAFFVTLALIILGLVVALLAKFKIEKISDGSVRRIWRRLARFCLTISILTGVTLFFNQTATPILGARWWYLLWLISGLVWLGLIIYDWFVKVPKERNSREFYESYAKYLPRSR
ncbi:MAG: hypothetical protein AAB657_05240 [Patescibacteria group bacterium]